MKATNVRVKSSAGTVVSERRPILRAMFAPNSVALIGASEKPGSVGRALPENLQSFTWPRLSSESKSPDNSWSKGVFKNQRRCLNTSILL